MTFGEDGRTLKGSEVDDAVAAVTAAVRSDLGGRLRS